MKIILAAADNPFNYKILRERGATNILFSYWYLRRKSDEYVTKLFEECRQNGMWVMMDSGAHSWFMKYYHFDQRKMAVTDTRDRGKGPSEEDLRVAKMNKADFAAYKKERISKALPEADAYAAGLVDFVSRYHQYLDAYAELDIDRLFGYDKVVEWREAWSRADLQPIVSIHKSMNKKQQEDTLAASVKLGSNYVGLEAGWGSVDAYKEWFGNYQNELSANKIRVHGWAMTTMTHILRLPFFSIDSSTYTMGQRNGMTYVYEKGSLRMKSYDTTQKNKIRPQVLYEVRAEGIDTEKFIADNDDEVARYNVVQWVKFQKDMEDYRSNAYWLDPDERTKAAMDEAEQWGTRTALVRHDQSPILPTSVASERLQAIGRYCNTCAFGPKCPEFEPNATCTLTSAKKIQSAEDLQDALVTTFSYQMERVNFAVLAERVKGQPLEEQTSKEMDRLFKMALWIKSISEKKASFIEQIAAGMAAGQRAAQQVDKEAEQNNKGILATVFGPTSTGDGSGSVGTRKESGSATQLYKAASASALDESPINKDRPAKDGNVETVDDPFEKG